jgi:hypothetical protein
MAEVVVRLVALILLGDVAVLEVVVLKGGDGLFSRDSASFH